MWSFRTLTAGAAASLRGFYPSLPSLPSWDVQGHRSARSHRDSHAFPGLDHPPPPWNKFSGDCGSSTPVEAGGWNRPSGAGRGSGRDGTASEWTIGDRDVHSGDHVNLCRKRAGPGAPAAAARNALPGKSSAPPASQSAKAVALLRSRSISRASSRIAFRVAPERRGDELGDRLVCGHGVRPGAVAVFQTASELYPAWLSSYSIRFSNSPVSRSAFVPQVFGAAFRR